MTLPDPVAAALSALGTEFEVLECDPAFADTAAFCERYGWPLSNSANTILVASRRGPQRYAACVVAADRKLDVNQRVRRYLEIPKMSFASAEETVEITGMEIGGVTVFGLPDDLPLLVDEALMELEYVIVGAGSRSAKIKASPQILDSLPHADIVEGLSKL